MDESTFNILLIVVILLVIIIFAVVVFLEYRKSNKDKNSLKFPPFPSKCPDYWISVGDGKCKNINNIGLCKKYNGSKDSDVMDFNDDIFKGEKGMYYKCSWARKCRVPWEGIDQLCI